MESQKPSPIEVKFRDVSHEQAEELFRLARRGLSGEIESTQKYHETFSTQFDKQDLEDTKFNEKGIDLVTFDYWAHYKIPKDKGVEEPLIKISLHDITYREDEPARDVLTIIDLIFNEDSCIGKHKYYPRYRQEIYNLEADGPEPEIIHFHENPLNYEETDQLVKLFKKRIR
jgi:hypothetical protein